MAEALRRLTKTDDWMIVTRHRRDAAALLSMNFFRRLLEDRIAADWMGRAPESKSDRAPETTSGLPILAESVGSRADGLTAQIGRVRRSLGIAPQSERWHSRTSPFHHTVWVVGHALRPYLPDR